LRKKHVFAATTVTIAALLTVVILEGAYALVRWKTPGTSLVHSLYATFQMGAREDASDADAPTAYMIMDTGEIDGLIAELKNDRVGLGNSPYTDLITDETALNHDVDGCLTQKPDQRKAMAFLRSFVYNPWRQLTFFYDADRTLSPPVQEFFDRYRFQIVHLTTNAQGERVTLPVVETPRKVIVAGDSVANGLMVDDADTIASQLQARRRDVQHVNIGIGGADGADVVCALERAAQRYAGEIDEIVYVFCENDFDSDKPYTKPEDLIAWLAEFRRRNDIARIVFVYVPYVYNAAPEITRFRGYRGFTWPYYVEEKRTLLRLAEQSGFDVADYQAVIDAEREAGGSLFAPLALYVDQAHLSRLGIERLVARLPRPPAG
jgi:hypothetical protein